MAAKEMRVLFYRMVGELFDVLPVLRNGCKHRCPANSHTAFGTN
jgi:hypothetical protein